MATEPELDLESGRPKYMQLAEDIRGSIASGEFPAGSMLPSERELEDWYNVSRPTIQAAYRLLRSWGLIDRIQGSGTYVRKREPIRWLSSDKLSRESFAEKRPLSAPSIGEPADVRLRRMGEEPCPGRVAERLKIKAGEKVWVRDRVTYVDGQPTMLSTAYFPLDVVEGTKFLEPDVVFGVWPYELETDHYQLQAFEDEVMARTPMPEEAQDLGMQHDLGSAVFDVLRVARTVSGNGNGRVLVIDHLIMRADRYRLHYTTPAV